MAPPAIPTTPTKVSPSNKAAQGRGLKVDIPTTPSDGGPGSMPRASSAHSVSTPATLGSVFSARSSTPRTARVNPSRHRRAVVLDKNLASSLSPLLPDLMQLVTVGEAVSMLPIMLHWLLRYDEEKLRLTLLDAVGTAIDGAMASTPLPCGMLMTEAPAEAAPPADGAASGLDAASAELASLRTSPSGRALAALREGVATSEDGSTSSGGTHGTVGSASAVARSCASDGVSRVRVDPTVPLTDALALDPAALLRPQVWGPQPAPFVYAPDTARLAGELEGMMVGASASAMGEHGLPPASWGGHLGVGGSSGGLHVVSTPGKTLVATVASSKAAPPHAFGFQRSTSASAAAAGGGAAGGGASGSGARSLHHTAVSNATAAASADGASRASRVPTLTLEAPQPHTLVRTHGRVLAACTLVVMRLGRLLQTPTMEAPVLRGVLGVLSSVCSQSLSASVLHTVLSAVADRCAEHYPESLADDAGARRLASASPGRPASPGRRGSVARVSRPPVVPRGGGAVSNAGPLTVSKGVSLQSLSSAHSASGRSFGSVSSHDSPTVAGGHVASTLGAGSGAGAGAGAGAVAGGDAGVATSLVAGIRPGVEAGPSQVAATPLSPDVTASGVAVGFTPDAEPDTAAAPGASDAAHPDGNADTDRGLSVSTAGDGSGGANAGAAGGDAASEADGASSTSPQGHGRGLRLYASALVPPAINQLRAHHIPSPISMSGAVPRSPSGASDVLWRGPPPSSNLRLAKSSSRPKALSLEEDVLEVGVNAAQAAVQRRRSSKELGHIREHEVEQHEHPNAVHADEVQDGEEHSSPVKGEQSSEDTDEVCWARVSQRWCFADVCRPAQDGGSDWDDWDDWDEEEDDNQGVWRCCWEPRAVCWPALNPRLLRTVPRIQRSAVGGWVVPTAPRHPGGFTLGRHRRPLRPGQCAAGGEVTLAVRASHGGTAIGAGFRLLLRRRGTAASPRRADHHLVCGGPCWVVWMPDGVPTVCVCSTCPG